MNRALRVGDVVCVRPDRVRELSREETVGAEHHVECIVTAREINGDGRGVLFLQTPWSDTSVAVWPSQVRLHDGAEERLHRATVAMAKSVAKMKQERQRERRQRRGMKVNP